MKPYANNPWTPNMRKALIELAEGRPVNCGQASPAKGGESE